jgi:hypothetical protein
MTTEPRKLTLDLTDEKDRGLVREAMKRWPRRWRGLTEAVKEEMAASLRAANSVAIQLAQSPDPSVALDAAKTITSVVRTAVAMEAQVQADEHLEAKEDRLDSGKATENVGIMRVLKPDVMKPKE